MQRIPRSHISRMKTEIHARSSGTLDRPLLLAIFALLGIGLLMIASAGVAYGKVRFGDEYFFLKQQCFGFAVGITSLFIVSRIDYHIFRKFVVPLFFLVGADGSDGAGENSLTNWGIQCFVASQVSSRDSYRDVSRLTTRPIRSGEGNDVSSL